LVIATILVLADARFGVYPCLLTLLAYLAAPIIIRPTILFLAPALTITALLTYAGVSSPGSWGNMVAGRFLYAGYSLTTLDPLQVLGVRLSDVFASGYAGDFGYGYVLAKVGLVGVAAAWGLIVYAPAFETDAWRSRSEPVELVLWLVDNGENRKGIFGSDLFG
jgi:putative polymerase